MARRRLALLLAAGCWGAARGGDELCDEDLVVAIHRQLEPAVAKVAGVHFNLTGGRHAEVVEVVGVYQVDQLCRGALAYLEALRLALGSMVCPARFRGESGLLEKLGQFFVEIRYLAGAGGDSEASAGAAAAWDNAEQELRKVSTRLEEWAALSRAGAAQFDAQSYSAFRSILDRMYEMISDFTRSMAEDLGGLLRAPNFLPREMFPDPPGARPPGAGLASSVFADSPRGRSLRHGFLEALRRPVPPLAQPAFSPGFEECAELPPARTPAGLPPEFLDAPAAWAHRDVSGGSRRVASPMQLLLAAAQHTRLSDLFISVQVSPYVLSPSPECGSKEVAYDPSHCLLDQGWAGYFFQMNPLPPYNFTVVYAGKPLGPGVRMPQMDVHSIDVPSMDTQWSSLVSTFKSMNHHSPDTLFVSPLLGNCLILDRLLGTGSVRPKLIYAPINPLAAPPAEDTPNLVQWWSAHAQDFFDQLTGQWQTTNVNHVPVTTSIWQAQCSLASTDKILHKHGYRLLHVEHTYATFMWTKLADKAFGPAPAGAAGAAPAGEAPGLAGRTAVAAGAAEGGAGEALRAAWLQGWHCSPHARFLFDLESRAGGAPGRGAAAARAEAAAAEGAGGAPRARALGREEARRLAAAVVREAPAMRYFLERPGDGGPRGRCAGGLCECFPPYRGPLCEHTEDARVPQTLRAAVHYITAETEGDLSDLTRSLVSLWERLNWRRDYPVLVFHEGLSPAARERIVGASENRVWLVMLPKFKEVPEEWAAQASRMAQDFSVGYRAMIRWRSGPVFLEPALASFEYAMTLDTDSYFPADLAEDPFEMLKREGITAAFPHLGRESASVVVNFMNYFLLYCKMHGLHPRRTRMLESLIEKNFKWYQQCMMLDIEVLRLDWFRSETYQDLFRYMDSTGGFWLHRWGNNPFRTFAVAVLLNDTDVRSMTLPYAHQDSCSCGAGAPPCRLREGARFADSCAEGGGVRFEDLAEGLLDLQPWRGTDRQRKKFAHADIVQFVEEQLPGEMLL